MLPPPIDLTEQVDWKSDEKPIRATAPLDKDTGKYILIKKQNNTLICAEYQKKIDLNRNPINHHYSPSCF